MMLWSDGKVALPTKIQTHRYMYARPAEPGIEPDTLGLKGERANE